MLVPYTKDGKRIEGTLERIEGVAFLKGGTRLEDGTVALEYAGETEVLWDTQTTVTDEEGQRLFVHDGTVIPERDVDWREEGA